MARGARHRLSRRADDLRAAHAPEGPRASSTCSALRMITNTAAALSRGAHRGACAALFPQARALLDVRPHRVQARHLPAARAARHAGRLASARGIPNDEVWIVDEHGRARCPTAGRASSSIRGANVMRGYWEKPEETAERLKPGPLPGEMVLYTGDLFRTDEEGYLYFVGRKDDIIKTRGEKVSPREVENALYACEGVLEAAVIGVPDEILGQAVKAFVVLKRRARAHRNGHPPPLPGAASRTSWCRSTSSSWPSCRRPTPARSARRAWPERAAGRERHEPGSVTCKTKPWCASSCSTTSSWAATSPSRTTPPSWRATSSTRPGFIELITFIEETFGLTVDDEEMAAREPRQPAQHRGLRRRASARRPRLEPGARTCANPEPAGRPARHRLRGRGRPHRHAHGRDRRPRPAHAAAS